VTRFAPQWIQSGNYPASADRRLIGALWPAPASAGCAVTAAGTGMDVQVAPGQVAVPAVNGTGSVLCSSDATETLATGAGGVLPAPPSGTDRVDLIVCQPRSLDLDGSSSQEDFIFAVVTGAQGAPPGARPATPAGTVALAAVHVAGGAASLTAADITDLRPFGLSVPSTPVPGRSPPAGWLGSAKLTGSSGYVGQTVTAIPGTPVDVTVGANRRLKVSAVATLHKDATAGIARFYILAGPVGGWLQIGGASVGTVLNPADYVNFCLFTVIDNPSPGAHSYCIGLESDAGTVQILADPNMAASLLVEDVGPYP
jgi:hypothetical protein